MPDPCLENAGESATENAAESASENAGENAGESAIKQSLHRLISPNLLSSSCDKGLKQYAHLLTKPVIN